MVSLLQAKKEAGSIVLGVLKWIECCRGDTSEEGVTIVKTRENKARDKFGKSVIRQILPNGRDATEMKVAGADSFRDESSHREFRFFADDEKGI